MYKVKVRIDFGYPRSKWASVFIEDEFIGYVESIEKEIVKFGYRYLKFDGTYDILVECSTSIVDTSYKLLHYYCNIVKILVPNIEDIEFEVVCK